MKPRLPCCMTWLTGWRVDLVCLISSVNIAWDLEDWLFILVLAVVLDKAPARKHSIVYNINLGRVATTMQWQSDIQGEHIIRNWNCTEEIQMKTSTYFWVIGYTDIALNYTLTWKYVFWCNIR